MIEKLTEDWDKPDQPGTEQSITTGHGCSSAIFFPEVVRLRFQTRLSYKRHSGAFKLQ